VPPLNLFYAEPDPDRWLPFDRYPRRLVRRLVRGTPPVSGHRRIFLNLCAGLHRLGVPYRVNDYRHAGRHPDELACVIGKPFLLDAVAWKNPILFGAAIFSHPGDCPDLLQRYPVRTVVVQGEWNRRMFEPAYGEAVRALSIGIDTDLWSPSPPEGKDVDVLVYDKVRWEHDKYEKTLIVPVVDCLRRRGLRLEMIRYGSYKEESFRALLGRSRFMVFLCEHETQGFAYQQALACGVPILAWDRGGFWQDPSYYPHKVRFGPVSSVPYWDDRCGRRFADAAEFPARLEEFLEAQSAGKLTCRDYILENLTLERCAREYLEIAESTRAAVERVEHVPPSPRYSGERGRG
jgi:hypothetical protein